LLDRIGRERLVFGHRGVPREAPENTLASFQRALELGLDGVELDARLCRSGDLIVFHDDTVDKLTDGRGSICDLGFEELRALDAGVRFGGKFKSEKIPTLEEVLDVLGGKMLVNIELKTDSARDGGLAYKVVMLVEEMNLLSSVILSSFNPISIRRAKKLNPKVVTTLLYADDQPIHLRRAWASYILKLEGVHPRYPMVNDSLMKRARAKGWFVGTWTVDDASIAERLFQLGVGIVISNRPREIRKDLGLT
jgi:glycerophosphoryl diester phosphodiesterase